MKPFFQCTHCGKCCGPVPVTRHELNRIQKHLRTKPESEIERLKKQKREPLTCLLWDAEKRRCSVYEARPEICRMFGFYQGMVCPNNPQYATKSHKEGWERLNSVHGNEGMAGILSVDITWDNLEIFLNEV